MVGLTGIRLFLLIIAMLSAADDKNLLCDAESFDGRSLAGKHRKQSRRKATEVMLDLIKTARQSGLTAKYVLFDSWFSSPKTITALKQEQNLDVIAMIKKKDWLAIISTDTGLSEEEIIRIYGKRWDIEVFFKSCKSYLHLVKECRSLSYDALTAHVAIVFTRYMMLSVAQRKNEADKTICKLFFCLMDELDDITFSQSMRIIVDALMDAVMEYFHINAI